MSDTWAQLSTLVVALVCFQVGERLDGSGLVTALAGGLAFAFAAKRAGGRPDTHVSDADGQLLELGIFAMFGAYAPRRALPHLPRGLASGGWRLGSLRRRPGRKPARPGLGCR